MTSTEAAPKRRGPSWSHELQQRYSLRFDESLADWFDSGVWQLVGRGEFNQAVAPEVLLADTPEVIWPALMLPDTLPVLGNRYGDWLCLRVGRESTVEEVVHWYHGGGDWIPWGETLAEAIAFDTAHDILPGRRQGHAVPAEPRRPADGNGALARWAAAWLPAEVNAALDAAPFPRLAAVLLEHRVSEVALRCELVLAALDSGLRRSLTPEVAAEIGIAWEPNAVSWLFDSALVDRAARGALRAKVGEAIEFEQDWRAAAEHALAVCQRRGDLGWAFDVGGWAAERSGDVARATELYRRGAVSLAFADQSIRFRTHWFPQAQGKFSVWRLGELARGAPASAGSGRAATAQGRTADMFLADSVARGTAPEEWTDGYLAAIEQADLRTLRSQAAGYWHAVGCEAMANDRPADAYDAFYRAGWDLGLDEMSHYRQRLVGLVEAAEQAGQMGRARIAQTHLDTFLDRFG